MNNQIKSIQGEYNSKFIGEDGKEYYTFTLSTGSIDRHNEKVTVAGIEYQSFLKNPVCLDQHNSTEIENIVGTWSNLRVSNDKLFGDLWLNELTPKSRLYKAMIDNNQLNAVSIGFISISKIEEPVPYGMEGQFAYNQTITNHTKSQLIEVSLVVIPANKEALRVKLLGLFESQEKELEVIEKIGKPVSKTNQEKIKIATERAKEIIETLKDLLDDEDEEIDIEYSKEIEIPIENKRKKLKLEIY